MHSGGLFHGFFTEYLNHCPMTYGTWSTQTQIRHATAPASDGPWTPLDVAVPDAAGNPVLTQVLLSRVVALRSVAIPIATC